MSVVACPKCAEKVTLPAKAPPEAKVRCPLCGEQYLLFEAMIDLPPTLEIVELPDGFSVPSDDVSISREAFLTSVDRPAPTDDEGTEFKLEGDTGTATAVEESPRYDEWGRTSSSTETAQLTEVPVKREFATGKPRRKKKGINPLFHVVGIVLGGALAFPVAFYILLWLDRDPLEIGPWLGERVPAIVPVQYRSKAKGTDGLNEAENKPSQEQKQEQGGDAKPVQVAENNAATSARSPFIPEENYLDDQGNPPAKSTPAKADDTPLLSGDEPPANSGEPALPVIEPIGETDLPGVDPIPEPTSEPEVKPEPEKKPEPEQKPEPEPSLDLPLGNDPPVEPVADPVAPAREALTSANEAFDAAQGAEKKSAAVKMYTAAATLAEQLPGDATSEAGFAPLLSDPKKLQLLGAAAPGWLDKKDRDTNGVVLYGTVLGSQKAGERYEVRVELPSRDKREVLVIAPAEFKEGDKVFVAGRAVENAAAAVSGYEGSATNAIDGRVVTKVE